MNNFNSRMHPPVVLIFPKARCILKASLYNLLQHIIHIFRKELVSVYLPPHSFKLMSDLHGSSEFNGLLVNSFFRHASTYVFNPWIVKILKIYLMLHLSLSTHPHADNNGFSKPCHRQGTNYSNHSASSYVATY